MNNLQKYKRIFRIIGFTVIFLIILCVLDYSTGKNVYENLVWEKIEDPNVSVDILIMGNSHAYTSIDAQALSECLGKEIDILGSGSQNMEDTLAALKIVLAYEKPDIIILDVYAVCNDSKDELQNEKRGLLYNNLDGVNNYLLKVMGVSRTFKWNNVLDGTFQVFRPIYTWDRWSFQKSERTDTHGYTGRSSYAYGSGNIDDYVKEIKQIYTNNKMGSLTEYNLESFQRFLDITEKNEISVILCSSPTCEPSISERVNKVFELAEGYENIICMEDMGMHMANMKLTIEDFYDLSHLNRRGAAKNTEYISDLLAKTCNLEKDWSRVFAYKSEKCEELEDGRYAYTMVNYSSDCLYQFRAISDGEIIERQDYSQNNTFITGFDIANNNIEILCYMIPISEASLGDKSASRIGVKFLKPNECNIEE